MHPWELIVGTVAIAVWLTVELIDLRRIARIGEEMERERIWRTAEEDVRHWQELMRAYGGTVRIERDEDDA